VDRLVTDTVFVWDTEVLSDGTWDVGDAVG
jgi:hypothetical protein